MKAELHAEPAAEPPVEDKSLPVEPGPVGGKGSGSKDGGARGARDGTTGQERKGGGGNGDERKGGGYGDERKGGGNGDERKGGGYGDERKSGGNGDERKGGGYGDERKDRGDGDGDDGRKASGPKGKGLGHPGGSRADPGHGGAAFAKPPEPLNPPQSSRPAYRPAAEARPKTVAPTGSVALDLGGRPKPKFRAAEGSKATAGEGSAADTIGPSGVLVIIRIIRKTEILFNVWF